MDQAKPFFPALESLRGLAALLVLLFHLPAWYAPFAAVPLFRNGYLMVDFFFVLSGFVLALNYAHRIGTLRQFAQFAAVRAVRLYPVHLVFLLLFLLIEAAKYFAALRGYASVGSTPFRENDGAAFFEHLFLLQGLSLRKDLSGTFNGPSWSISTEFFTYLFFGGALLVAGTRRLAGVCLFLVVAAVAAYTNATSELARFQPFFRCLFGFFVGCLVFILSRAPGRWPSYATKGALVALVGYLSFQQWASPVLVVVPLSALLITAVVRSDGDEPRWLARPAVRWLGKVSYSLYMSHALVLWFANQVLRFVFHFPDRTVDRWTGPAVPLHVALVLYPATMAVCFLVAAATYRWVEAPSLRWIGALKKRFL